MPKIYLKLSFLILLFLVLAVNFSVSSSSAATQGKRNEKNLEKILEIPCNHETPLRFVVLGDTRSNPKTFAKIIELTNSLNPDFVIHNGDVVDNGEKKEYDRITPLFDKFKAPVIVVPGNHDITKSKKNLQNFENIFGFNENTFDVQCLRFILVDNSKAILTNNQLTKMENDLDSDKIRIVIMHAPPHPIWPDHNFKAGAERLVNIIKKTGCEYAFFGHIHGYDHRMIGDKCHAYITGGGGAELNGYGLAKEVNHVLLVTVMQRNVKVEMVPLK